MYYISHFHSGNKAMMRFHTQAQTHTHLPQLLVEVGGVDLGSLVALLMVEVEVPANEEGTQKLLHLHSDIQRNGDDEVVQNQESQEIRDELQNL